MKAIIPVAGSGTRLLPHTYRIPKSFFPALNRPVLFHIIDELMRVGICEIVLVVNAGNLEYFRQQLNEQYDIPIKFILQKEPLGLGHAVHCGLTNTYEPVVVAVGDNFIGFGDNFKFDNLNNAIYVVEVDNPKNYGVVEFENNQVIRVVEKPKKPVSHTVLTGVYYFQSQQVIKTQIERLFLENIQTKGEFQITDAIELMIENGEQFVPQKLKIWLDFGDFSKILLAHKSLLRDDNLIDSYAEIINSEIINNVVIGAGATVENSTINNSVVLPNATVVNCRIENSIIGFGAKIYNQEGMFNIGAKIELQG